MLRSIQRSLVPLEAQPPSEPPTATRWRLVTWEKSLGVHGLGEHQERREPTSSPKGA